MKRLALVPMAAFCFALTPPASAAIDEPPGDKLSVDVEIHCSFNRAKSYWQIYGDATVDWRGAPEKKGRNTIGHYLLVKTEVWGQAFVNGTFSKRLAREKYRSTTVRLESNKLPRTVYGARARYNTYEAGSSYYTKVTVRVVREVDFAPDATAWKGTYKSPYSISCDEMTGIG